MFITSFGEQNITYRCCSNFLIHLSQSMVTNKLTFAVFALVVLFPIYFDAIFLYTVSEAGWTFDFYSYLHFSILSKFNLLFFSILFDTPPDVIIDLTRSHIWDVTSVAMLDSVVNKFQKNGANATVRSLNEAISIMIDKYGVHSRI